MRIQIICPARPGSRFGNRITALRWQRLLRQLRHRVSIQQEYTRGQPDVLVAMHARRSAKSVRKFDQQHPSRPIIVALTGTDLYRDVRVSPAARSAIQTAARLVVLQTAALDELRPEWKKKTKVIYQSAWPLRVRRPKRPRRMRVAVIGHLRSEKDPFRAAYAVRDLPSSSRIVVDHFGAARESSFESRARNEMARNHRYIWHGEVPRWQVRQHLARSAVTVLSSRMEGGANVLTEALVDGVPVLASKIPGSWGMLGLDYSGYFPVGDSRGLRDLLCRFENNPRFRAELSKQCAFRARQLTPARELAAWRHLLSEL